MHAQLNATLKSYYRGKKKTKRRFWQTYGGGQLPPYVCGDEDNKSGGNYQSSSGGAVKTPRRARSDWRCHGDRSTLPREWVFTETLRTQSNIFIRLVIRQVGVPGKGGPSGMALVQFAAARGVAYAGITISRWRRKAVVGISACMCTYIMDLPVMSSSSAAILFSLSLLMLLSPDRSTSSPGPASAFTYFCLFLLHNLLRFPFYIRHTASNQVSLWVYELCWHFLGTLQSQRLSASFVSGPFLCFSLMTMVLSDGHQFACDLNPQRSRESGLFSL